MIADTLDQLDAEPELRAIARRAVDEERRHAQLCNQVATAYLGREAPPPARLPPIVPEHPGATPELRRTLHVLGMCAINETSGSAYLEACLSAATAPLAHAAALRELLADEWVDHARASRLGAPGVAAVERRDSHRRRAVDSADDRGQPGDLARPPHPAVVADLACSRMVARRPR